MLPTFPLIFQRLGTERGRFPLQVTSYAKCKVFDRKCELTFSLKICFFAFGKKNAFIILPKFTYLHSTIANVERGKLFLPFTYEISS